MLKHTSCGPLPGEWPLGHRHPQWCGKAPKIRLQGRWRWNQRWIGWPRSNLLEVGVSKCQLSTTMVSDVVLGNVGVPQLESKITKDLLGQFTVFVPGSSWAWPEVRPTSTMKTPFLPTKGAASKLLTTSLPGRCGDNTSQQRLKSCGQTPCNQRNFLKRPSGREAWWKRNWDVLLSNWWCQVTNPTVNSGFIKKISDFSVT